MIRLWLSICLFTCVLFAELRDVVIMQTTDMHGVFEEEDSPQPGSWLRIATMVKNTEDTGYFFVSAIS